MWHSVAFTHVELGTLLQAWLTMMRKALPIVAACCVSAFAPTPSSVRRRQPLYSKLPKRLRTSDLDAEGRCDEAGIIVKASPGKGFGAFAAKDFDEDITVADYVGEQLTQAEVDVRYKKSKMDWKDRLWRKSRQLKGITVSGDYIFASRTTFMWTRRTRLSRTGAASSIIVVMRI